MESLLEITIIDCLILFVLFTNMLETTTPYLKISFISEVTYIGDFCFN